MTRRILALASIAAALGVPGVASAAPPEGSLHLTTVATDEGQFLPPHSFTFTETVYQGGKSVGSDRFVCKFVGRFENVRCRVTLSLPNGRLFLFLRLRPDPYGSFQVTSGTGAYRGKSGVGIYKNISETRTKVTIWLTSQRSR